MERISSRNLDSPIGTLGIEVRDGFVTRIVFGGFEKTGGHDPALDAAETQLREYFAGARREFEMPLRPEGTPFQQKVWQALMEIPYGETRAYSDIAAAVGSPKAARAVGMANHVNPIPVVIPCHRVVGKGGSLTGYAGGLDMKTTLLELEKQNSQ